MTEREKLILHLQNLLKSNTKSATLDVTFLLNILNALPKDQANEQVTRVDKISIEVDGGDFGGS